MNYQRLCGWAVLGVLGAVCLNALLRADEQSAGIYLQKALEAVKQKNYVAALELFDKAVKEAPDMPEIYYERGMLYWKNKEMSEGISDLNKAAGLINALDKPSMNRKNLLPKIAAGQSEYKKLADEFDALNQKYMARDLALLEQNQANPDPLLIDIMNIIQPFIPESMREQYNTLWTNIFSETGKKMTPLFNGANLGDWEAENPNWTVENGAIIGQFMDSLLVHKHTVQLNSGAYAVSAKVQILEENPPDVNAGILFGGRFDQFLLFGVRSNRVELVKFSIQQDVKNDRRVLMPNVIANCPPPAGFDAKQVNELMIIVDDDFVDCYLNGKRIMGKRFAGGETGDRKSFYGAPGLSVLRCKAQFTDFKYLIYE
ncbi:MAG: tetratricopeptide repeat protein [Planctomycetes bacterium]|nr:tetratricopeptide repeat protein [Planctomycetota bacterium]